MENMRLLQRHALRQLFETRPLTRRAFNNSSSFRRGPVQQQPRSVARTLHTQRNGISHQTSSSCLRRRCVGGRRIPTNGTRSTNGSSRRYNSGTATSLEKENLSIKDRLKKLSREYGWTAVGVYLALSALDFPFCFLAVRTLGTDRIGRWEHAIVDTVKGWVKAPFSTAEGVKEGIDGVGDVVERDVLAPDGSAPGKRILEEETATQQQALDDHGYRAAEKANSGENASLWTQLALAYAIHKSFIFVRVPLTAAILPKVVRTLRGWGWNIGKVPSRKAVTGTPSGSGSGTGVNTKGAKVKGDD